MNQGGIDTVFLDRDGTINEKPPDGEYVLSPDQLKLLPSAAAAIRKLNAGGVKVIVLTNQRCVARGLLSMDALESIHHRLRDLLAEYGARIDAFFVCPHEEGTCECRKPRPGLFHEAIRADPSIDLSRSVMIGDSWTDFEAASAAGVPCILLATPVSGQDPQARDLADAVSSLQLEPAHEASTPSSRGGSRRGRCGPDSSVR